MRNRLHMALLALLLPALPARAQTNLATYVAVGDSLTAGVVSGSLVQTHQANSYPALIARQAGISDFQQPLVAEPGLPPELALTVLLPAPVIGPKSASPGAPTNSGLGRSYNNLAVPGATSVDCLSRATDGGGVHDLVLRGRGTQVQQAVALRPTFVTLWIGANDVLGAVLRGRAVDGVTLTPAATFRQAYQQIVDALRAAGAPIVAANVADVTAIPFATTVPAVVVNPANRQPVLVNGQPVPLLGPTGPLPPGSLVTLAATPLIAQGIGIPSSLGGRGTALPDEVILDPAEVATIRDRVTTNNRAIGEISQAAGIPVLDVNALQAEIATTGRIVGGIPLTSAFLTGGVFSYDGVHPTDLGYALIANEFIRLINEQGGNVPFVDLGPFVGVGLRGAGAAADTVPRLGGSVETGTRLPMASAAGAASVEFSGEAYEALLALFPALDR